MQVEQLAGPCNQQNRRHLARHYLWIYPLPVLTNHPGNFET